jgi:hypothetical protein
VWGSAGSSAPKQSELVGSAWVSVGRIGPCWPVLRLGVRRAVEPDRVPGPADPRPALEGGREAADAAARTAGWLQGRRQTIGDMTTLHNSSQRSATAPEPSSLQRVVAIDRFLAAVVAGSVTGELYTDGVSLDATVPGWRFHRDGAAAVVAEYSGWFAAPGLIEELERLSVADGEVVTYLLTWEEHGVPHAAHHCHHIVVDPVSGRIAFDRVFCGGRWAAELVASMAEAGR